MRYPVLAAQKDALEVHVLHALPGVELRLQDRVVVRWGDAGVVKEHVQPTEALGRLPVHCLYVVGVRDVRMDVDAVYLLGRLPTRIVGEVGDADVGAFLGEAARRLAPDAARPAGDDRDLPSQTPSHFSPPPR